MTDEAAFREFLTVAEPRLRRAFAAAFGPDRGPEAAAEAVAYAWEHWSTIQALDNPIGYLYRVGRSRTRPPRAGHLLEQPVVPERWVEPKLGPAFMALPERQRVAVALIYAAGLSAQEAAAVLGISASAARTHASRGVAKLRRSLRVHAGD